MTLNCNLSVLRDVDDVVLLHRPVEGVPLFAPHHPVNLKNVNPVVNIIKALRS